MKIIGLLGRSRIWGRGYTTIPVTVRRVLDIKSNDGLEWYMTEDGRIFIKKRDGVKGGG